jgi:hypothetical protein
MLSSRSLEEFEMVALDGFVDIKFDRKSAPN